MLLKTILGLIVALVLNAEFKGRHADEYAWFALANGTPGLSMHAQAAANHLQFAQPAQRIQRIAASAGLRQATHRPAAIGGLLQVQRQATQA